MANSLDCMYSESGLPRNLCHGGTGRADVKNPAWKQSLRVANLQSLADGQGEKVSLRKIRVSGLLVQLSPLLPTFRFNRSSNRDLSMTAR